MDRIRRFVGVLVPISRSRWFGAFKGGVTACLLIALGACGSGGSTVGAVSGSAPAAGAEAPAGPTSSDVEPGPAEPAPTTEPSRVLPNLVGKGLQVAQDGAQAAGFRRMTSHDATNRKRIQLLDRDWKVCFQYPSSGRRPVSTPVDFGAVKLDERCPATDQGNTPARRAQQKMPDLRGKSAANAIAVLILDSSITWRDGTGADRTVLLPTNWRVCAQSPKPGAKYSGVPVTLTVVKLREKC